MISNNQGLLSQKLGMVIGQNKEGSFSSNPQSTKIKHQLDAKIRQSHSNLFNFIKDNLY